MQHEYSKEIYQFVHHTCQTHAMHRASGHHTGHLLIQTCKHTYVVPSDHQGHNMNSGKKHVKLPGTRDGRTELRCEGTGLGLTVLFA